MTADASPPAESLVHVVSHGGHHAAYQQFLGGMLDLAPATGPIDRAMRKRLIAAGRLLFATLDDDVPGFVRTAVLRSLRGRPTAGLFLHATSCTDRGLKARVKWALFAGLKRLPGVTTISILPFDLFPATRAVASAAIADPQLWDLLDQSDAPDAAFAEQLQTLAAGRPVLAYVGWATAEKDFAFLSRILAADPDFARAICVVAAGRVAEACRDAADRFCAAGGTLFDRFVSDAEMAALYQIGQLIWVCYAPGYDQASGIFGRSVQRGKPVAIRETSTTIAHFCDVLAHPHVRLPSDPARAAAVLKAALLAGLDHSASPEHGHDHRRTTLLRWRDEALTIMRRALDGRNAAPAAHGTSTTRVSVA